MPPITRWRDLVCLRPVSYDALDDPIVERRWSYLGLVAAAAAVLLLGFIGALRGEATSGADRESHATTLRSRSVVDDFESGGSPPAKSLEIDIRRSAYAPLKSLSLYGFENVVEPFRNTTLRALGGAEDSAFRWTVYRQDGQVDAKYSGQEAAHVFTRVTESYRISLLEVGSAAGITVNSCTSSAMCKYVRRDTHSTSDEDRQRTLAAMRVMFDVSGTDGRALYGPKYVSFPEMNVLHLDHFTELHAICQPWHFETVFVTAHQAMALQVEQSLQAIDPALALPYWDPSYEASLGEGWRDSEMFSGRWFGSWGAAENGYRLVDSVFAGVRIPTDCNVPEKNSYCRVTNSYNNDPSEFLTRSDEACGLPTQGFITCALLLGALEQPSYATVNSYVALQYHGLLHGQFGGMWGCRTGLLEALALAPGSAVLRQFVEGTVAMLAGPAMFSALIKAALIRCPERCREGVPFEECRCDCPILGEMMGAGRTLHDASWHVLTAASLDSAALYAVLADLPTDAARHDFVIWFAKFVCSPGRLPPFASALGAFMDPIFAPLHAYNDYLMQTMIMTSPDFVIDWDDEGICPAHALLAQLPWGNFTVEGSKTYTNQELRRFFRPDNPLLPYVYDDFTFDRYCKDREPEAQ